MTWIDTYEARVIELAVGRLKDDGVLIPERHIKGRAPGPPEREINHRQRIASGLNDRAEVEPDRSSRARLRGG